MSKSEPGKGWHHFLRVYAYSLLCAILTGCATTSGNFDLGRADAELEDIARENPELAPKLMDLRANIQSAKDTIAQSQLTIDRLSKLLDASEQKSTQRLIRIWQLTSALLSILLVVGIFIAWKLR